MCGRQPAGRLIDLVEGPGPIQVDVEGTEILVFGGQQEPHHAAHPQLVCFGYEIWRAWLLQREVENPELQPTPFFRVQDTRPTRSTVITRCYLLLCREHQQSSLRRMAEILRVSQYQARVEPRSQGVRSVVHDIGRAVDGDFDDRTGPYRSAVQRCAEEIRRPSGQENGPWPRFTMTDPSRMATGVELPWERVFQPRMLNLLVTARKICRSGPSNDIQLRVVRRG